MTAEAPVRAVADGIALDLRVAPGAARTKIAGVETDGAGVPRLKLRISAPPVDGAANAAALAFLAKAFKRPKRACALTHGDKNRSKTVFIEGDADELLARLRELLGEAG